jgi:hypothetical protein
MATNAIPLSVAQAELEKAEAELRRQQQEVEQLRSFVQGYEILLRRMSATDTQQLPLPTAAEPVPAKVKISSKPKKHGRGLTVVDLAIQELEGAGTFLSTSDLTDRMVLSGYKPRGTTKPRDAVYATLFHAAKKEGSRLVKAGATFGLRDWP